MMNSCKNRGLSPITFAAKELKECRDICSCRGGVKTCKVTKGSRTVIRGGEPIKELYIVPGSMNCVCNEDDNGARSTAAAAAAATMGAGYLVYRGIRMLPSLFPPLWPTIPANAAVP